MRSLFLLLLFCSCAFSYAQDTYMYRLMLKDKGTSPYLLEESDKFLSQKSLERRIKQGFVIDETDLPIDPAYLEAIAATGAEIRTLSKWVNTVVVALSDEQILSDLQNLSFVEKVALVWKGEASNLKPIEKTDDIPNDADLRSTNYMEDEYGSGYSSIKLHNGNLLHDLGYKGAGMTIAVMDGGFKNANKIDYFNQSQILGVKSFTHEDIDPLGSTATEHGTWVLSCMLSNKTYDMIGTAPDASFYLFKTEVDADEYPIEEDYWVAALEYADSLGVDIVTTSLGYTAFNDPTLSHTHDELDGQTIPASRAASMAASKGLLLFQSAGNEGYKTWRKISVPGDADNILTVGSVSVDSIRSSFSGIGNTSDGRIKPDVMALGTATWLVNASGIKIQSKGTSFSTPIMAGLAACLWQACPDLNSFQMIAKIREASNQYSTPDNMMGYGIPDVFKAYSNVKTAIPIFFWNNSSVIETNADGSQLFIDLDNDERRILSVYNAVGSLVLTNSFPQSQVDLTGLKNGFYIAYLQSGTGIYSKKFIKR